MASLKRLEGAASVILKVPHKTITRKATNFLEVPNIFRLLPPSNSFIFEQMFRLNSILVVILTCCHPNDSDDGNDDNLSHSSIEKVDQSLPPKNEMDLRLPPGYEWRDEYIGMRFSELITLLKFNHFQCTFYELTPGKLWAMCIHFDPKDSLNIVLGFELQPYDFTRRWNFDILLNERIAWACSKRGPTNPLELSTPDTPWSNE